MNGTTRKFPIWIMSLLIVAEVNPARAQQPASAPVLPASNPAIKLPAVPATADRLQFNFRGVPLDTVLDYLSRAAGFIIVKQTQVSGQIDVVSHQSLTRDEAVLLLNTVLNEKGYAAIRNERTLTIVTRDEARKRGIPVKIGGNPETIPKTDEMVTQIIPVRHANAEELLESIRELLPSYATISANASSNALVLTDTQSGVRRIAEIVQALDQSISSISELKVFALKYADAKEAADLVTSLFQTQDSSRSSRSGGSSPIEQMMSRFSGGPFGGGPSSGGGGDRGGDRGSSGRSGSGSGGSSSSGDSPALRASSRVTAQSDERTNSLIVSAPEEVMPTIEQLVQSIDKSTDVDTLVHVFPLQFADATEMSAMISSIFGEQDTQSSNQRTSRFGGFGMFGGPGGGGGPSGGGGSRESTTDLSERKLAERTVVAVADVRTNSVIVSAVSEVMQQVAGVVSSLDQNPAKAKRVYTYSLKNADPEEVTTMLQEMFSSSTNSTSTNRNSNNSRTSNTSTNRQNSNSGNSSSGSRTGTNSGSGSTR